MRTSLAVAGLLLFFLVATPVWGDIPPGRGPRPLPPSKDDGAVPLVIQVDEHAKTAKLQVPRKLLGSNKGAARDGEEEEVNAGGARDRTVVAGFALSGAVVLGGLWFVRRRGRGTGLALLLTSVALLGVGGVLWADIAPSRPNPPPPAKALPSLNGRTAVEIVDRGDTITLTISPAMAVELAEKARGKAPDRPRTEE